MAQTLKFGNGTWATKKGSTLAYSDTNNAFKPLPFTYTGAGKGTRVNKEGLIEVVENDRPRIDYTDSEDGVFLLENAATNYVTYSEDLTQSSWLKINGGTGVSPSITSNYAISPDGTQNASRVILDAPLVSPSNLSMIRTNASGLPTPHNSSTSFYIKSNTIDNYTLLFYNGSLNPIKIIANSSWQRIELSTTVSTSSDRIHLGLWDFGGVLTDSYADVSIWGAQLEVNSVVSSYIPTQGTIQTRVQETANGSGNSEVFSDSQGVLFANIAANANDGSLRTITLGDGSSSNAVSFRYDNPNQITLYLNSGGASQFSAAANVQTLSFNKCLIKYKANDFSAWVNGFEIGTDTSGSTFTSGTLDRINFDIGYTSTNPFYGKTKEIAYYDEVLTDLELETLTSYRTWEAMVKELNLNIIHNE